MSQLQSGLETLSGIGNTQANSLYDANLGRADAFARELALSIFNGDAQAGAVFDKYVLPYDVYVEKVIFNAYMGAPTGADLILKVKINGTDATKNFTLTAGQNYGTDTPTNPTDILVTAGQTIEIYFSQVGSTKPGSEIKVRLQLGKRKL